MIRKKKNMPKELFLTQRTYLSSKKFIPFLPLSSASFAAKNMTLGILKQEK